jgi:serine/threonine protein kinase
MPAPPPESAARRYRIEKYLTEGGMGAIYIGKKLGPGGFAKEVVLKQLLPEYTSRPEFRDLFFREAKISATLDHANIVHTFDLVESDQSLFIVMEYVRGADLRTIIRRARQRKRELAPAAAIHIALEILAGLGYAHARRDATGKSLDIIHRDVSPSNIICSVQGAAKLSDFGIAKASTYSSVFYRVRGKVGYMSPEQARSQQIDHRCDLFSLAVCLYESLSGERLFLGDLNTPADDIYGIKVLPVSRKRAGLPPALDEVMARALATQIEDRYQSAAELAEALRTVAHKTGLTFSAPELASHLQDILGEDADRWLRDEPAAVPANAAPSAAAVPALLGAAGPALVGTEAASIGIVNDVPGDEPGRSVLSPRVVTGGKDFDLDSMLNDEATRPGNDDLRLPASAKPHPAQKNESRARPLGTPPPVWTRDSGPFALATPSPVLASDPARNVPSPAKASVAPPAGGQAANLPGVKPASPPTLPPRRSLPRATVRGPAPPPFAPVNRPSAPPAPPRSPRGKPESRGPGAHEHEIEDPTPGPQTASAILNAPPSAFAIEDVLTPPPPALGRGPTPGAAGSFRSPPASYPSLTLEPPDAPIPLARPPTLDFSNAAAVLLPEKNGPPGWLSATMILLSLVGGAALAYRLTRSQVAAALTTEFTGRGPRRAAVIGADAVPSDDTAHGSLPNRPAARLGDPQDAVEQPPEVPRDAPETAAKPPNSRPAPHRASAAASKPHHAAKPSSKTHGKH